MEMNYRTTRIQEGRRCVVIEGVTPEIDAGRVVIRRTPGERVAVEAGVSPIHPIGKIEHGFDYFT